MIKNACKIIFLMICLLPTSYATAELNTIHEHNTVAAHNVLLLGDSLSASYGMAESQGWVTLLNLHLQQQNAPYQIINASISGETTGGGLARLPAILAKQPIDVLFIELGGNDGLRGFPPKVIKQNLIAMVELAQAKNIPVYLMSIRIPPNYGPRYNKMFTAVFSQVSEEKQVPLLPFFMENIAPDAQLMQADGIHPNVAAQPKIADFMAAQLATMYQNCNIH